MNKIVLACLVSCFLFPLSTFPWGQTGHRAIAHIAQTHLHKKTEKRLYEIMGHETLVEASTWMDNVRSDSAFDYMQDWHWVTVPTGKSYAETEKNPRGDAIEALARMQAIIRSEESSREEKRQAIRVLVHLVGDLHQPLHIGTGEDRGGNEVKIKWFYDNSNLHRIWDSEIIKSKELSYSELGTMVNHPHEDKHDDFHNIDTDVWVAEAQALRPQIYAFPNEEYLSYEYIYYNWPVIKVQIEKAGHRLAAMLNHLLED
jgi:hypothetical protein